ncbi:hypothetical protein PUG81_05035 [Erwiniaceae bacterium L1_54_6]|nr:hypothetical protein [Erwiniaceae bacterium L1_54_6]
MKLKLNENGFAFVVDGKPVYLDDADKEIAFDAPGTAETIKRLNAEAKGHREAKETAEAALKNFEGISDPVAALKAIETLKALDDKKLIDAGQVEQLKEQIKRGFEQQIEGLQKGHAEALNKLTGERDSLQNTLFNERIGGQFDRSTFIKDNLVLPPDIARAAFGNAFKIEDNKIVAYDPSGNKIFSRARPGELASFDEAIESLVDNYPSRDYILKGTGASGGNGGNGNGSGRGKSLTRNAFENLSPSEKQTFFKEGGELTE